MLTEDERRILANHHRDEALELMTCLGSAYLDPSRHDRQVEKIKKHLDDFLRYTNPKVNLASPEPEYVPLPSRERPYQKKAGNYYAFISQELFEKVAKRRGTDRSYVPSTDDLISEIFRGILVNFKYATFKEVWLTQRTALLMSEYASWLSENFGKIHYYEDLPHKIIPLFAGECDPYHIKPEYR